MLTFGGKTGKMRLFGTILSGIAFVSAAISITSCGDPAGPLPRTAPDVGFASAFENYLAAIDSIGEDIHSIMVVRHGKVIAEKWLGENRAEQPHIMNSTSKSFTSMAAGLAIEDGLFALNDKVSDFFPDKMPDNPSENLLKMTVRDLLTMTCGHATDPTSKIRDDVSTPPEDNDWIARFLAEEVVYEPGTHFCYNSMSTFMVSAIIQKCTGQKVVDYLGPRLFDPLGIARPHWEENPAGINCGGWGLYIKTEDMAKFGLLLLNGGKWHGKQVLPQKWVEEASSPLVESMPANSTPESLMRKGLNKENSDWLQGYGYQLWRCRHNAFRADGAKGQYIIVIPEKDAVIAMTAHVRFGMQKEIDMVWKYLLPTL